MCFQRLMCHLLTPSWWALRPFDRSTLDAVEAAIANGEQRHRGEVRFVVEGALPLAYLFGNLPARDRAVDLFSQLRIWDTAENTGILIYVQRVDRRVEIVADRGIAARVAQAQWDDICRGMEEAFRAGEHRGGAVEAIRQAERLLIQHFPATQDNVNELPDQPLLL